MSPDRILSTPAEWPALYPYSTDTYTMQRKIRVIYSKIIIAENLSVNCRIVSNKGVRVVANKRVGSTTYRVHSISQIAYK